MKSLSTATVLLLLVAVALLPSAAQAADSYTYVDDDVLWRVDKVWYWYQPYGYHRQGYWAYYTTYTKVTSAKDADWRAVMAKYAGQIRLKNEEHQAFLESARALGLDGAAASIFNNYQAGTTTYGYGSKSSLSIEYGALDLNAALQGAERRVSQGNSDIASILREEVQARKEVALTLARGEAAAKVMGNTKITATATSGSAAEDRLRRFAVASASCTECHSGDKADGKFRIADYPAMSLEEKRTRVWPKLLHHDPEQRMPLGKPVLTMEHLRSFLEN